MRRYEGKPTPLIYLRMVGSLLLVRLAPFLENHRLSGARAALSDYYTAAHGAAVFDKSLRERAVFSSHNLASDSVFAETRLVSCRNVLIYLKRDLQNCAVGLFKESLVRRGFLGLGHKESLRLSAHAGAFSEFSRAERIYQRRPTESTADAELCP
jgi:chemotaxis protein methyltransferase CheR